MQLIDEPALSDRMRRRVNGKIESDMSITSPQNVTGRAAAEVHFLYTDRLPQLPVLHDGRTVIYEWGNRNNKESRLYRTGWCRQESLEAGKWRWLKPEPVTILADFGLEKSVGFHIEEGMEGIVVRDEQNRPHVYMLTEEASHYYQVMTRHDRMPVLLHGGF